MTLVSVVIPTYNRSEHIQRAIQSVLGQTYSHFEIIVVDDRSQDNTVQIVQEYVRTDSRIRLVVHSERKGAQAARNTGIQAAAGEWIAFLDSDDQWLPHSLNSRLQLAQVSGLHVVHSDCYVVEPTATGLQRMGIAPVQGQVYTKVLEKFGPMFQGLLVSKEALARIGYLDEKIVSWQEWDTAIRLARHYRFGFITTPTFIWDCHHPDSISKDRLRKALGYEQVFTKHRRSILRYLGRKYLAFHYQLAADYYREANDRVEARRCLLRGFLLWPFRPRTILRESRRLFRSPLAV